MSRRFPITVRERKKIIKSVVKAGFDYVQFDEHHYRFEGMADFWPSTGRWRFGAQGKEGFGAPALVDELKKRMPA